MFEGWNTDGCNRNGPSSAEDLWVRCQRMAGALARAGTIRHQDVEDFAPELFVSLTEGNYRRLRRYDPSRAFEPWLWRCARNLAASRRRGAGATACLSLEAPEMRDALVARERTEAAALARLEGRDLELRLRRYLQTLGRLERQAFELRFLQGCSYDEIATRLGVAEVTVRMRCSRARSRLQHVLTAAAPGH